MNPRHAAALALVGWYLMVPPMTQVRGHPAALTEAPLGRWNQRIVRQFKGVR